MIEDNYISDDNNIDEFDYSYSKTTKSNKKFLKKKTLKNRKKKGPKSSSSSKISEKLVESVPVALSTEAKYRNSILSATIYNEYLRNERIQISKHFLKRKLKAAFEREPLDKCKGFFNVPFIPSANMFNIQPTNPQQPIPQQNSINNPQNPSYPTSQGIDKKVIIPATTSTLTKPITTAPPVQTTSNSLTSTSKPNPPNPTPQIISPEVKAIKQEPNVNSSVVQVSQKKGETFTPSVKQFEPNNPVQQYTDEKKADKEIVQEYGQRLIVNNTPYATNNPVPIQANISQGYLSQQPTAGHQGISQPVTGHQGIIQNPSHTNKFPIHASEIKNLIKDPSSLSYEQLEALKKHNMVNTQNIANNFIKQQIPVNNYPRNSYGINPQNESDQQGQSMINYNLYDNSRQQRQIPSNLVNINQAQVSNIQILKALKEKGNLQMIQSMIKSNVTPIQGIPSNFSMQSGFKNDSLGSSLENEIGNFQPHQRGVSLMNEYRNAQYLQKSLGGGSSSIYGNQSQVQRSGYSVGSSQQSSSVPQTNVSAEDLMNSFNLNNNYD